MGYHRLCSGQLRGGGPEVRIWAGARYFLFSKTVQTASGAHPGLQWAEGFSIGV